MRITKSLKKKYLIVPFFIVLIFQNCSFGKKYGKKTKKNLKLINSLIKNFDRPYISHQTNNSNNFNCIDFIKSHKKITGNNDLEQKQTKISKKDKILIWGLPHHDGYGDIGILANVANTLIIPRLKKNYLFNIFCDTTHSGTKKNQQLQLLIDMIDNKHKNLIINKNKVKNSNFKYIIITPYNEPNKTLLNNLNCKKLIRIYEAGFRYYPCLLGSNYILYPISLGIGDGFSGLFFKNSSQIPEKYIKSLLKKKSELYSKNIIKFFKQRSLWLNKDDQKYFINTINPSVSNLLLNGDYFFCYAGGALSKSVQAYYIQAIIKYNLKKNNNKIPENQNDKNLIFIMPGRFKDRMEASDFAMYIYGLENQKKGNFIVSAVIIHKDFDIDEYQVIKYTDSQDLKNGFFIHIITGFYSNKDFNSFMKGSKYPFSLSSGDQSTADTLFFGEKILIYDQCGHKLNFINNLWSEFKKYFSEDNFCEYEQYLKIHINSDNINLFPDSLCYRANREKMEKYSNQLAIALCNLENKEFVAKYKKYINKILKPKYNLKETIPQIVEKQLISNLN